MSLEREMKKVAAALTGQETDGLPDNLEAICSFIAENYDGCLCSECLHTIKDSFYLYGTNPIYRYHVQPNPHVCSRK